MNYLARFSVFISLILIANIPSFSIEAGFYYFEDANSIAQNLNYKKTDFKVIDKHGGKSQINTGNDLNDPPIVDFSFTNDNSCSGTLIQFTSNVTGTGPFTYNWDFGDGQTSTAKNPTHTYNSLGCGTETFTISLAVTDADTIQTTVNSIINVIQRPDISFIDKDAEIGEENFSNCSDASIENPNYSITVENTSKSKDCIESYSIDWGDGNSLTDVTFPVTHEYTKLGAFNMVITAKGSNNCENSVLYIVKNQTNPSGGITSPGTTTDLCAPTDELQFSISGWGTNSPGTTYLVDYGDGTVVQITQEDMEATSYFNSADPASSANYPIPHTYTSSSCPIPSFTVNLTILNSCSQTPAAVGNITIITKPEPDFTAFPTCVNQNTLFTNKTINGSGKNCSSIAHFTWDFGDGSPVFEQNNTLPQDVNHVYTTPGVYNVTLTAINNTTCGENSITKPITISAPPAAAISGSANVCLGDSPPLITFTGADGTPPYTFTYKINNGTNRTISTPEDNNMVTIEVPTDVAGTFTYSLVSVSASSCSQTQTGEAVITINSAPIATIAGTDSVCINSASPSVIFKGQYGIAPYTFTYNINGGASKTITTVSGDTVSIKAPTNVGGTFRYNLTNVTDNNVNASECTLELNEFVTIFVNDQPPELMVLDDYEFCNGETTSPVNFSNTVPGTTYTWSNDNTSIGLPGNGMGNIGSFTAKNNTSNPITSTITVTPSSFGCTGSGQTFTIEVFPAASVVFSEEDQVICSGESTTEITLSSETSGVELSWTVEQPDGISESLQLGGTTAIPAQTLTNNTDKPITISYEAKATHASAIACSGIENIYTITVLPKPFIQEILTDTICSGHSFNITPVQSGNDIVPVGTRYTWDEPVINPAGALAGFSAQNTPVSIIGQTLQNSTSALASATYRVTPTVNNCEGETFNVTVYVIPNTSLAPVSDIILCDGDFQNEIVFGNNATGTVFQWTSDNENIGMSGQSGSDRILSFTAINTGTTPEKATIKVESNSELGGSGCDVSQIQFSITVNPAAQVNNPGIQNVCNGEYISIPFSSVNTGGTTIYEWTNSNAAIGLEASGSGDISFKTINQEDSVIRALINVTPTYTNNGLSCSGKTEQFLIKINPPVIVVQPENQTVCSENITSEIIFSGNNSNIEYNWTINNKTIGLAESGTGNIPEFTALNDNSDSVVAVVTVVPILNGCAGETKDFTITVYPSSVILKQPSSSSICLGESPVSLSVFHTTGVNAPNYQWYSNTSNSIIGATLIPDATNPVYEPSSASTSTTYYFCEINFPGGGGCNSLTSEIVKVKVSHNPVIVLNDEQISRGEILKICPNDQIPIKARGAEDYKWSYGFTGDSMVINDIGDYRVIGTSEAGCRDTFPFSVSYYDFWDYTIETDKEEITNDQAPIIFSTQDIPGSYYSWDFGDGTTAYGNTVEHIFDIEKDGYIEVHLKVENPDGCFEEATKRIWVNITFIPNTFTPNGDGKNDFYLEGWYKKIYNRNGILLYEGEEGWDGNYKGNPVANDTYFVVIYDSSEFGASYKTNFVTVLR